MSMDVSWMIVIVLVCGSVGGFANVFIGDNGLHLPKVDSGSFQPGFLGTVLVGAIAAMASWGSAKAIALFGLDLKNVTFTTGDIANPLIVGFGGAKWFKSEVDKAVLQKAAAIAASKSADQQSAINIASGTPVQALAAAQQMKP